jgi:hypothetical protein
MRVTPQTARPGVVLEDNYATSGRSFTLDGVDILGGGDLDLVIAGATDGLFTLQQAILKNIKGARATVLNRSSLKNCTIQNLDFQEIALSTTANGFLVNSAVPTGNIYQNVKARGGPVYMGKFAIDANNSLFIGCGCFPESGDTVDYFNLFGSGNTLVEHVSVGSVSHGIQLEGNNNYVIHPFVSGQTDRTVLFKTGTAGNIVSGGGIWNGQGVLDLGTNSYDDAFRKFYGTAAPGSGAWRVGDRVINIAPAAAAYVGWICTVAGSPGTWKGYGAIEA